MRRIEPQRAAVERGQRDQPQPQCEHHTKAVFAAAERPEQFRMMAFICLYQIARAGDDSEADDLIGAEPMTACEWTEPTSEQVADYADAAG